MNLFLQNMRIFVQETTEFFQMTNFSFKNLANLLKNFCYFHFLPSLLIFKKYFENHYSFTIDQSIH